MNSIVRACLEFRLAADGASKERIASVVLKAESREPCRVFEPGTESNPDGERTCLSFVTRWHVCPPCVAHEKVMNGELE